MAFFPFGLNKASPAPGWHRASGRQRRRPDRDRIDSNANGDR
jgi:hypothetical protein